MEARKKGFTLIELLVVISIIAMLMSILLPALRKARRTAEGVRCAANMRSIGMAFAGYEADSKGAMPFAAMKVVPASGGAHASFWCLAWDDLIGDYLGTKLTGAEKEAAFNYRGQKVLVCPGDEIPAAFNTPGVWRRSYAVVRAGNAANSDGKPFGGIAAQWTVGSLAGYVPDPRYGLRVNQVRRPSETLMVVEHANAWNAQGYDYEAFVDVPAQVSQYATYSPYTLSVEESRKTFHGDRWNFLFVDGHVASMRLEETAGDFSTARGIWTRDPRD